MGYVMELLKAHLAHLRRTNARPDTIRDRRDNILRWERWLDGVAHGDVTEQTVQRWQDHITGRVAASSAGTYVSHVRAFYGWAYDYGHLPTNPAARIRRPRIDASKPRAVPTSAFQLALRTATGDLRAMLILCGYLGLRVGEVSRLRREDVLHELAGHFLLVRGKGGKQRVIPLPRVIEDMLGGWLTGRSGPVFTGNNGQQLRPGEVTYTVSTHFQALGLHWTAHNLRHRAASRLLQLTKDVRLVQTILGHSSLSTTAVYLEVTPEYAMSSMDLLGGELHSDLGLDPDPAILPPPGGAAAKAA